MACSKSPCLICNGSRLKTEGRLPDHFLRRFKQTVFCVLQIRRDFEEICKQKETAFGISKQASFSKQIKTRQHSYYMECS